MGILAAYLLGIGSGLLAAFVFVVLGYRISQLHAAEDDEA